MNEPIFDQASLQKIGATKQAARETRPPADGDYLLQVIKVNHPAVAKAGIKPGDYIVVHRQDHASEGHIVIAELDGEYRLVPYEVGVHVVGRVLGIAVMGLPEVDLERSNSPETEGLA